MSPSPLTPPLPDGCTCEPADDATQYAGAIMYDCPHHTAATEAGDPAAWRDQNHPPVRDSYCCGGGANPGGHEWNCRKLRAWQDADASARWNEDVEAGAIGEAGLTIHAYTWLPGDEDDDEVDETSGRYEGDLDAVTPAWITALEKAALGRAPIYQDTILAMQQYLDATGGPDRTCLFCFEPRSKCQQPDSYHSQVLARDPMFSRPHGMFCGCGDCCTWDIAQDKHDRVAGDGEAIAAQPDNLLDTLCMFCLEQRSECQKPDSSHARMREAINRKFDETFAKPLDAAAIWGPGPNPFGNAVVVSDEVVGPFVPNVVEQITREQERKGWQSMWADLADAMVAGRRKPPGPWAITEGEWLGNVNADNPEDDDDQFDEGCGQPCTSALPCSPECEAKAKAPYLELLAAATKPVHQENDVTEQPEPETVYIAGPMTGYDEWNHPAFFHMAADLRCAGYRVICPAELHVASDDVPWDWYLRRDLAELVNCDRVVMLQGWERSKGARLEHYVAEQLGMTITYPHEHKELLGR